MGSEYYFCYSVYHLIYTLVCYGYITATKGSTCCVYSYYRWLIQWPCLDNMYQINQQYTTKHNEFRILRIFLGTMSKLRYQWDPMNLYSTVIVYRNRAVKMLIVEYKPVLVCVYFSRDSQRKFPILEIYNHIGIWSMLCYPCIRPKPQCMKAIHCPSGILCLRHKADPFKVVTPIWLD